jgi:hypothetical protein
MGIQITCTFLIVEVQKECKGNLFSVQLGSWYIVSFRIVLHMRSRNLFF